MKYLEKYKLLKLIGVMGVKTTYSTNRFANFLPIAILNIADCILMGNDCNCMTTIK